MGGNGEAIKILYLDSTQYVKKKSLMSATTLIALFCHINVFLFTVVTFHWWDQEIWRFAAK